VSKYELDDHDVEVILQQLHERGSGMSLEIAERLSMQIPIPVPVKVGAVVRAETTDARSSRVYLRWAWEVATTEPWIEHGDHDLKTYRTDEIGRITEVLSPGVDL